MAREVHRVWTICTRCGVLRPGKDDELVHVKGCPANEWEVWNVTPYQAVQELEARAERAEYDRDSLRLERDAIEANRLRDNTYLLEQIQELKAASSDSGEAGGEMKLRIGLIPWHHRKHWYPFRWWRGNLGWSLQIAALSVDRLNLDPAPSEEAG